jgi:hypothetical protein
MWRNIRWHFRIGILILSTFSLGSCRNAFRDFGDRTTDEYLINQTRYLLDQYDFEGAIGTITNVLGSQPTNPEVVYLAAAAHAGHGGLRILDLFSAIANESSTKGLIQIFAEHFPGADDDTVAEIDAAITIIENYDANPLTRDPKLNFFTVFLLFSRMGVITSRYALDETASLKADFDNCHREVSETTTTGIPNLKIDSLIDAFIKIPLTIANSGSSQFASISDALSSFPLTAPGASCAAAETAGLDAAGEEQAMCLLMRLIIGSGADDDAIGLDIEPAGPNTCLTVTP